MILKFLKIFLQNLHKNKLLTDTILENNKSFDILFIQEPSWSIICSIPSSVSEKGEDIIGTLHHLSWIMFTRLTIGNSEYSIVITYINVRLIKLCFYSEKTFSIIFNHWDINLISFFNHSIMCFIINVYSDDQQTTLKYLKNTEVNLNNVLIMIGDFNIRNNIWNSSYPHHLAYVNTFQEIVDSFNLELSLPVNQVPTQYTDNPQDSNLVLDLMFFCADAEEFNNHLISLNLCSLSNHAFLSVYTIIKEEVIQDKKQTIIKNSEEEKEFINKLRNRISCINTTNILNSNILEDVT